MDRVLQVNVQGPLRLVSAAVRAWMGEHGGSIVNIASVGGINPETDDRRLQRQQGGADQPHANLAHELGGSGVRVNAIAPGLVDTISRKVLIETPKIHDTSFAEPR